MSFSQREQIWFQAWTSFTYSRSASRSVATILKFPNFYVEILSFRMWIANTFTGRDHVHQSIGKIAVLQLKPFEHLLFDSNQCSKSFTQATVLNQINSLVKILSFAFSKSGSYSVNFRYILSQTVGFERLAKEYEYKEESKIHTSEWRWLIGLSIYSQATSDYARILV